MNSIQLQYKTKNNYFNGQGKTLEVITTAVWTPCIQQACISDIRLPGNNHLHLTNSMYM